MNPDPSRFRLGINYWPSSTAMRWWQCFDIDEVERDFTRIREVGFRLLQQYRYLCPRPKAGHPGYLLGKTSGPLPQRKNLSRQHGDLLPYLRSVITVSE